MKTSFYLPNFYNGYIYKERDYLIPSDEWLEDNEQLAGELNVYNSPLIEKAFNKTIEDFIPSKPNLLITLCTHSRPYYKSPKFEKLINLFGPTTDIIVGSNGGIIPRDYWECYPYLEYDAHREADYDALYLQKFKERLEIFMNKFASKYEKIVFLFTPNQRNYPICEEYIFKHPELNILLCQVKNYLNL